MNFNLEGKSIIATERGGKTEKTFTAFNPATGEPVAPAFYSATIEELNRAAEAAERARIAYGKLSGAEKAAFLRKIAENTEALGDGLIERANLETALPAARLQGERARTGAQLRLFADLIEEGSWVDARIDSANPERQPVPKPDVRSMFRPIGAVAVFCASNFPLAFSVAGGDTASALAAGCPVVVIAHAAHPGTAEIVGAAISDAVKSCGLPPGVFSLLFAADYEIGQKLVAHPAIKAVGFTGSRQGGQALMKIAAARSEPIPVYAEMSSVNPVFILHGALEKDAAAIAKGLHGSFTLGAGQFCTKPGVVVLPEAAAKRREFADVLRSLTGETDAAPLLTRGIGDNYREGIEKRAAHPAITSFASAEKKLQGFAARASFFEVSAENFVKENEFAEEIFGPATLLVDAGKEEVLEIARQMEGQLTATVFGSETDLRENAGLIEILETKVGRLIFNSFPTGVEVCHAMVHGGVYPATSDSRSTSVGTRAINRFCRLVCYQGFPQEALPDELKNENPLGVSRLQDGRITRETLAASLRNGDK